MNRLSSSSSAYLRSAAHQPVHWYEWGDDAFEAARREDKPILLDIGAVWCHWCHVIDRESYENPEIAAAINASYIPVKVDVDARPDIDRRYQEVVQALTGQGGWPLTAFLTPEGEVIYGGTYFPPEDRWGMPGMKTLLARIAQVYRENRAEVTAQAKRLHEELARVSEHHLRPSDLDPEMVDRIVLSITSHFDPEHGGFGDAPKFPTPTALELLLRRSHAEPGNLGIVTRTLDAMAAGGIRDQLGGAFHRYATDRSWRVPHFEVMLYAQGELLKSYAQAYQATGNPAYAQVLRELLGYLERTLSDRKRGGYYGSQDADATPDDDGDYWTWTLAEAHEALAPDRREAVCRHYGIEQVGEMRENPAKNVLYQAALLKDGEQRLLEAGKQELLAARARRKAPFVDTAVYTGWNALAVSGTLAASAALGDGPAAEFAYKTLERIWTVGVKGDVLHHVILERGAEIPAFLDDHAYLLQALLDAYELSQDRSYLVKAIRVAGWMVSGFWDEAQGGFFDVRADAGEGVLRQRRKPVQDSPTPACNSVAALALTRLYHFTGDKKHLERAEKTLASFAGSAPDYGLYAASFGIALDAVRRQPTKVVIVGPAADPRTGALLRAALSKYRPDRVVQVVAPAEKGPHVPEAVAEILENIGQLDEPTAFVCSGTTCAPPATAPEALAELVESFGIAKTMGKR